MCSRRSPHNCERVTLYFITFFILLSTSYSLSDSNCTCNQFSCCFLQETFVNHIWENQTIFEIVNNYNCSHQSTEIKYTCPGRNQSVTLQVCKLNRKEFNETSTNSFNGIETLQIANKREGSQLSCGEHSIESQLISTLESHNVTPICCRFRRKKKERIKDVYIVLLFIGAMFLLATLIIHLITWETHTVHGWAIFSEVLSNFSMIFTVGLAHAHVRDLDDGPASFGCLLLATSSHFFFLSTFCWMSVINFNLWRDLSTWRRRREGRWRNLKLYLYYALFAIGIPLLIVIVAVILDAISDDDRNAVNQQTGFDLLKRPYYGKTFCYINKDAQGHYIYYPIGTLIVCNVILFILTTWTLIKHRQSTRVLTEFERPTQSVLLFAKLFCVMGVSWCFCVIAWAVSGKVENVPIYWVIFDVTNLVQGACVFLVFVCKREVFILLKGKITRLGCFKTQFSSN